MYRHPARAMYDQLDDTLRSITMQLRSAIQADARQISAELASVLLGTLGLAATIEWHVRQFQTCTGILCDSTVNNAPGFDLPQDHAEAIFYIYNEALSNIARHAKASHAAIALTITPREVVLVVANDGGPGSKAPTSGAEGFAAIQARAQTWQGSCEVAGGRNGGTTVTVRLPVS
jgi:signal transduction histidine kinase